jgi:hypothetical protein
MSTYTGLQMLKLPMVQQMTSQKVMLPCWHGSGVDCLLRRLCDDHIDKDVALFDHMDTSRAS